MNPKHPSSPNKRLWQLLRRCSFWLLISVALLYLVVFALRTPLYDFFLVERTQEQNAKDYAFGMPEFLKDADWVRDLGLFNVGTRRKNAGPIIEKAVGWLKFGDTRTALKGTFGAEIQKVGKLGAITKRRREPLTKVEVTLILSIDTSWVSELANYDHCLFDYNRFKGSETFDVVHHPTPDIWLVRKAALVHLYKAEINDEVAVAVDEVTHLVRLLGSAENLLTTLVGLDILKDVAKHFPNESHFSQKEVERLKKFTSSAHSAWSFFQTPSINAILFKAIDGTFLNCSGINEALGLRSLFKHYSVRERDVFYERLESSRRQVCCLSTWPDTLASFATFPVYDGPRRWMQLPLFRPLFGRAIAMTEEPSFWEYGSESKLTQ